MIDHPALDTLHRMLCLYRLRAAFFANPTYCNDWKVRFDGEHQLTFHLLRGGRCRLELDGYAAPITLGQGDLAVIAHRRPHSLKPIEPAPASAAHGEQDAATTLLCGGIEFQRLNTNLLLNALPECIVISREHLGEQSSLRRLLDLMTVETAEQTNPSQLVLDKLAGAMFAMVLRHYICCNETSAGIFAALSDRRLRPVLAALHADIGRPWQLEQLARMATMSRSAFAQYFKLMLGMPPLEYLTHWRMSQADLLLADAQRSVAQIGASLGYSSEAAFRRAFQRFFGVGPGHIRRERREQSSGAANGASTCDELRAARAGRPRRHRETAAAVEPPIIAGWGNLTDSLIETSR